MPVLSMMLLGAVLPALANLSFTCDPSIDTTQAGTCAALNGSTVAGVYNGIFNLSSQNINIYVTYAPIEAFGESFANFTPVSYGEFYNRLGASTDNLSAFGTLPGTDPFDPNGNVDISPSLASALGITENGANTAGLMSDGITNCTLGTTGCYNGVVMVGESNVTGIPWYYPLSPSDPTPVLPAVGIDFFSVVEHETDEVLGTVSCIGATSVAGTNVPYNQCTQSLGGTDASPADLFRYSAPGVRSFLATANGTPAYFSNDGGVTDIADYNNTPNGGDYGDWIPIYPGLVQDYEASENVNLDIATDVGTNSNHYPQPEVAVLDAVGFNLNSATPEPGTLALLGASLTILAAMRYLRRASM
ncbi:MAG TPA: NF038122 family metalloprotease [Bryobacteraceae bacterium]|nr:NF038122 family metalloprotease [Bryobacteraceae bacterium]